MSSQKRWILAVCVVAAAMLIAAQFLFAGALTGVGHWDLLVSGLVVALLAVLVAWRRWRWAVAALGFIGGWLIVAPSVLHLMSNGALVWTHEIAGAGLLAVAFSALFEPDHGAEPDS